MRLRLSSHALVCLLSAAFASRALAQGSLTPPGAPAPTMKRLDQVEPRTLIPGGTTPFVITSSGSYYLSGNLALAGGDAITVNASNVTVDLNGFTISSTASPAAGNAVVISAGSNNVMVRNGHISGPGTVSATGTFSGGGFAGGVALVNTASVPEVPHGLQAQDVTVTGCSGGGINFYPQAGGSSVSSADRCVVRHAGSLGIRAGTVRGCSVYDCASGGISATSASDCVAFVVSSASTAIAATQATNCSGNNSGSGYGVYSTNATNCSGNSDRGTGLQAVTAINCHGTTASGNFGLFASSTATNCSGYSSAGSAGGAGLEAYVAESCDGTSTAGIGLFAYTAMNCRGTSYGAAFGIQAVNAATNCFGSSTGNSGLRTPTATNCFGQSSAGTAAAALFAITATSCRGYQTGGTGVAVQADVAITCSSQGGTIVAPYKNLGTP